MNKDYPKEPQTRVYRWEWIYNVLYSVKGYKGSSLIIVGGSSERNPFYEVPIIARRGEVARNYQYGEWSRISSACCHPQYSQASSLLHEVEEQSQCRLGINFVLARCFLTRHLGSGHALEVQCWEESWWIQKVGTSLQTLINGGLQREVIKE